MCYYQIEERTNFFEKYMVTVAVLLFKAGIINNQKWKFICIINYNFSRIYWYLIFIGLKFWKKKTVMFKIEISFLVS